MTNDDRHFTKRMVAATILMPFILASGALAEQVTLRSDDGQINVSGDLISFDGEQYVVRVPDLGDLRIVASRMTCSGPGCPSTEEQQVTSTSEVDEPAEEPAPVRLEADLVMVGSDNVGEDLMPLVMEPFAELLNATVSEPIEFPDDIAQFVFTPIDGGDPFVMEVESNDSEIGFDRLIEGTADIAMGSGAPSQSQVAALAAQGRGNLFDVSQEYIIGVDSVLMTVHNSNPVNALSRQELIAIYSDNITNWAEVDGPNMQILAGARDGGSARRNFENWAFGEERDLSPGTTELDRGRDMRNFVQDNPGAIGYSISDNIGDTKPIDLVLDCGVVTEATPFKSKAEEYLLGRRIRLYIDNQNPKPEVRQLVNYMISPAADPYVAESGYFSLGIVEDNRALARLTDAALIGQPPLVGRAARGDIAVQLAGASRLSLTFRFATDDFTLDSKALRDLDRLVNYLARPENADREVIVVGFADTVGNYAYNVQLSLNRANQVLERIRQHPEASVLQDLDFSAAGFGEAAPVGCNEDLYGRSRNRRVEIWVR